jgi:diguanylate cyclase (GGDEF)-like protein
MAVQSTQQAFPVPLVGSVTTRDRRYRATERRDVREAVGFGAIIGVVILLVDLVEAGFEHPAIVGTNLVGIAALALLFTRQARRRPHPAAFGVLMILLCTTVAPGVIAPTEGMLMGGYLVLITVASALFLPWGLAWHGAWLVVAATTSIGAVLLTGRSVDYVLEFAVLVTAGALTSFGGNQLVRRRRERSHRQQLILHEQRAELRRVHARLQVVASEDSLTGLGNRRRLNDDTAELEARLARGVLPGVAAIMVDLDHFKAYNDRAGHPAGDEILRIVSSAVRGAVREVDHVYRYGGEELLVLLEEPTRNGAQLAASRILDAVRRLALPHVAQPGHVVTISAGAAAQAGPGVAVWQVIEAADQALYEAKRSGRDRAVLAPQLPAAPEPPGHGVVARASTDPGPPDTFYATGLPT